MAGLALAFEYSEHRPGAFRPQAGLKKSINLAF